MAPRAEDEQPDPPSDHPGGGEEGPLTPPPPPSQDESWAEIVARLGDLDVQPDLPGPHVVRPARPASTPDERPGPTPSGRDWAGTDQYDAAERTVDEQEHFVPPDPGPVLGGNPLLTMAWLAVAGMPLLWLVVLIGWRSAPQALLQASVVVFVLGLAVLVWRMPHRRDPDSGDDGAIV